MDGVQNPQSQGSQNQKPKRQATRPNFAAGAGNKTNTSKKRRGPSLSSKVLVGILIVVGLVITVVLAMGVFGLGSSNPVDDDNYQALFLTNGQVYFGKLANVDNQYVELTDIYYLQVTQPQDNGGEDQLQPAGQDQQISLAKLGNELHGPQDAMFVNRERVLFWENLKDEGQVSQAIQNYQEQQADGTNTDQNANQGNEESAGEEQ